MIKRPLNSQFCEPVLRDEKTTTIRDKPWPVGVPIMLYHWSGAAYRSKQSDVAPVVVKGFWTIRITHKPDGAMAYECGRESGPPIHVTEGFASQYDMDEWFRPLVKRGQTVEKTLMRFCRSNVQGERRPTAMTKLANEPASGAVGRPLDLRFARGVRMSDYFDGQWGTSEASDNCPDCGAEWSSGERLHTGDDKGIGGWEDWLHCKACGCEMFFPVTACLM